MDGTEPFGIFCDFRYYPFFLNEKEIEKIAIMSGNVLEGLPDKFAEYINLANAVPCLIKLLEVGIEFVKPYVLRTIGSLA
jgi:hypothetical protein